MREETKERIRRLGLNVADFEREGHVQMDELCDALCELAEGQSDLEAAVVELAEIIGGVL